MSFDLITTDVNFIFWQFTQLRSTSENYVFSFWRISTVNCSYSFIYIYLFIIYCKKVRSWVMLTYLKLRMYCVYMRNKRTVLFCSVYAKRLFISFYYSVVQLYKLLQIVNVLMENIHNININWDGFKMHLSRKQNPPCCPLNINFAATYYGNRASSRLDCSWLWLSLLLYSQSL